MSRKPWLLYILVGIGFGIIDWHFLAFLASITQKQVFLHMPDNIQLLVALVLMLFNYGVWLIPAIPIAVYETRRSRSFISAAMSAITVWGVALLSYYTYYVFLLMFVGLPNMDFMLFDNHQMPTYWVEWWPPFKRVILDQLSEWIRIAVVGGTIVGVVSAYVTNQVLSRHQQEAGL